MPQNDQNPAPKTFHLPGIEASTGLSRAHGPASRGGTLGTTAPQVQQEIDDVLGGVIVERHVDLSGPARSAGGQTTVSADDAQAVVALEMEDGFILYTSPGRLDTDLRGLGAPTDRDGTLVLDRLRPQGPATRGLGDWLLRGFSVLGLDDRFKRVLEENGFLEAAEGRFGDTLIEAYRGGARWAGAKLVTWAVERKLDREPGLYRWVESGPRGRDELIGAPLDKVSGGLPDWRPEQPILVFIHGTGSSTRGSFGELRRPQAAREWEALRKRFGQHIYGFEHYTLSESPIENALALAEALPSGARVSLVTHSRGGLVGDLLCLDELGAELVTGFARLDPALAGADAADRQTLASLARVLKTKGLRIERYARVACPAQGTLLASSHMDAFLSTLLHLVGLVPFLAGTLHYAVLKRIVLETVRARHDPELVPGIEAMLPHSPLAALLGRARPRIETRIAVIAGDAEADGFLKRIGLFLTDYLLFERENNDLVVDTDSMFGGLARTCGRYVYDQGGDVSHFRYFANGRTRRLVEAWLTATGAEEIADFLPMVATERPRPLPRAARGPRPVVIVLPGIMGSHLRVGARDRVWFDFLDIAFGGLMKIRYGRPNIEPDGLFDRFYGELCEHLEDTHEVRRFAYDWRRPLADSAARLAAEVGQALDRTQLPVRLLAHSMGGLVVRAMIAHHRPVWDRLVARDGGRWVMLGTPNRGSHGTVESLLGLSGTIRKLAMLAAGAPLPKVTELVAGFPGGLQLLPRPGSRDTGGASAAAERYYTEAFWTEYNQDNDDRWFGKRIGAVPAAGLLTDAERVWNALPEDLPDVERIAYVAGYGRATPCGIERREEKEGVRLHMVGTLHGDGTVTHDLGILPCLRDKQRVWYMDAEHGALTGTPDHFPALVELLERGTTDRLPHIRPLLRGAEETFRYQPGPVLYPTEQDMERALLGALEPPPRRTAARHALQVCVHAMDLRHSHSPILVGHYERDAISGAEAQIDRYLVDGALTMRYQMGVYSGPLGSVTVVLRQANAAQQQAQVQHGAIVIGLGELGERPLTTSALGEAVRAGVLRYLLQVLDRMGGRLPKESPLEVGLSSLLLGHNSTTSITIEDSLGTVIRGVMEANWQFRETMGIPLRVGRLDFIELYEDVAISAAKALGGVSERLEREARRLGQRIEPERALDCGRGMRRRLDALPAGASYWPRMIVTDAERRGEPCPPGCGDGPAREAKSVTAEPPEGSERKLPTHPDRRPELARRLRFLFLSQRARAETVEAQRQPGLVETLVERSLQQTRYDADLSRALFQLLVPHDFKEAARHAENLVLVVDGYTANLPWEMLAADDEPLVLRTAMVRQFASTRFRSQVRTLQHKRAFVLGNPSTAGYYRAFPDPSRPATEPDALPLLSGAAAEAQGVADLLQVQGYEVPPLPREADAQTVFSQLFTRPYRILHIAAHGVFHAGEGAAARTGVVLSDGLLLTAVEIGQLEVVPDLVFLNCCHLAKTDTMPATAYNRLAYSVARELIEIGVRVVIAAGWAVRDDAAQFFAQTFYTRFLSEGQAFGKAVFEARCATYEQFGSTNTWGAFQAYGDPAFVMDPGGRTSAVGAGGHLVAPQELIEHIAGLCVELDHVQGDRAQETASLVARLDKLLEEPNVEAWLGLPEVLHALARFYADAAHTEKARRYYEEAIAIEDTQGHVPVSAIEQLANLEARQGARDGKRELIDRAIDRLTDLVGAAGGDRAPVVNPERCAILGSAYKRLASVLTQWSGKQEPEKLEEKPEAIEPALRKSLGWYRCGEGAPDGPQFSPYNALNRLAVAFVLGEAESAEAGLALRSGEAAIARYPESRDDFDLIMSADALLVARLIDGKLSGEGAEAAEAEIITRYREVRERLPENARQLDSVRSQLELLAAFLDAKARASADQAGPATAAAERLRCIARALADTIDRPLSPPPADRAELIAIESPSVPPPEQGPPPAAPESAAKKGHRKSPARKK